jgi:hypothetical protein
LKFDEKNMQLDDNPFPTNMVNFEDKKVLIRPSQAESAKGKNVVVGVRVDQTLLKMPEWWSEEASSYGSLQNTWPKMIKPKSPKVDRWKIFGVSYIDVCPYEVLEVVPGNSYLVQSLQREKLPRALNGKYSRKYYPSVWHDA